MNLSETRQVKRRDDAFAEKTQTKIWLEKPCQDNPYITETAYCHGYELQDLMQNCSLIEVIFLLYKGELPGKEQKDLLEKLFIGLINPGPRHAATRAAMNTGVGKTNPLHILPIASMVMGGERGAAGEIEAAMRFFRKTFRKNPAQVASDWVDQGNEKRWEDIPGFGQIYGGIDVHTQKIAAQIASMPGASDILGWASEFATHLADARAGWLRSGLAAAVFTDLGILPKLGGPLYQLISAPGLIAHGFELYTKPLTAMPYVKDENYVIQD